jgi:polyisoprenoid-binding protein YceI
VDGSHAFAIFKVSHLGIAPAYGQFLKISGGVAFDAANPTASTLSITIDTKSVFSGNKKRDDHLKGPDLFDVKQFPKATFVSKSWKAAGENTFEVTGDLTIKGRTQSVTAKVIKSGEGKDPWGNDRIGFTTELSIDRMAFGVDYMPEGLGKTVNLTISLEAIKKK